MTACASSAGFRRRRQASSLMTQRGPASRSQNRVCGYDLAVRQPVSISADSVSDTDPSAVINCTGVSSESNGSCRARFVSVQ